MKLAPAQTWPAIRYQVFDLCLSSTVTVTTKDKTMNVPQNPAMLKKKAINVMNSPRWPPLPKSACVANFHARFVRPKA